jgi:predicted dehydrogenase
LTPLATHFDLAAACLRAGKHVLVEKPLTNTADDAARLIDEGGRRRLVLMVDHTFVYTPAVTKIADLACKGELGRVGYSDSIRTSLGGFQREVGVLFDLACHDLAILDYLLAERPVAVSSTGLSSGVGQPVEVAYLTLFFPSNLVAHLHVSWRSPVKLRRMLIGGDRRIIIYDDLEPSAKVRIYDAAITHQEGAPSAIERDGDRAARGIWTPPLEPNEALSRLAQEFVTCIAKMRLPLTDGEAGIRVVRVLEAAHVSLAQRGRPIELPTPT